MLKIAIEFSYNNTCKSKDRYWASYYMQEIFRKNNIELVRVSINKFNKTKNEFNEYNYYDTNGIIKTIKAPYKPDIVWNRWGSSTVYKYVLLKSFMIVVSEHIAILANDKYETYMFLKKYQPKTFLLSSVLKNTSIQEKHTWPMVLKPIRASGGDWIEHTTIQELCNEREKYIGVEQLFIVQEFKDFSQGYPGIVAWNHDVRFMFAGEKIVEITLRVPAEGNFKSNIWSGGSQFPLDKKNVPLKLIHLAKKIYKEIAPEQKEIFSIDFAFCAPENKRYVLEINASPGTRYYQTDKKILKAICMWLVKFFKGL